MELNRNLLDRIAGTYGDTWYLLDTMVFEQNFKALSEAFCSVYSNSKLAYSYKTNYIPELCRLVDTLGGYAEVVSEMEYRLALTLGVQPNHIIFNGPYKTEAAVEALLVSGGQVNIDADYELEMIRQIASRNADKTLRVALRCNFDIGDGVLSRFGWDTESAEFAQAVESIRSVHNLKLVGLHCHFATRELESFRQRSLGMLKLLRRWFDDAPEYISLGGGLFGQMEDSLARQFDVKVPTFADYAATIASVFADEYGNLPENSKPVLFLEPGSSLSANVMQFVTKVVNIKNIRGKAIATVTGSVFNINARSKKINPPIRVVSAGGEPQVFEDLDIGGYTCIETDLLYRHYQGPLSVGDYMIFGNVGSYSLSFKPPFIMPNVPIVEMQGEEVKLIKRQEVMSDIFGSYLLD
jgi:diaminopimelate decarboxylase